MQSKLSNGFSSLFSSLIHSFSVHVYRPRSLLFSSMVVSRFCSLLKVFLRVRVHLSTPTAFLIDSYKANSCPVPIPKAANLPPQKSSATLQLLSDSNLRRPPLPSQNQCPPSFLFTPAISKPLLVPQNRLSNQSLLPLDGPTLAPFNLRNS